MNIYALIILIALILNFVIDTIADLLNMRNLSDRLPDEFSGVYTVDKYVQSQEYTRVKTMFSILVSVFSLLVLLSFWFLGGFGQLDIIVRTISESKIIRGLLFVGILLLGNSIITIPLDIYSTFVIEGRFGFNKTTVKTYILDLLKGLGLSLLIGAPVLALILYILDSAGVYAWLWGWIAVTLITFVIQFLAPRFIMPLFNKFKPLEEGELRTAIMAFAEKVKFPISNVFVIDGSKRSAKTNAFFTGFGKNKRIALYDTLIEKHSVAELVAILAHEIGHYKKKHITIGMVIGIAHTGLLFWLLSFFLRVPDLFHAFYVDQVSIYAGLLFFGLLYTPVDAVLSIAMNVVSRKHEYEADRFAVEKTGKPEDMIKTLKVLSETNLSNLTPHPFYVYMNYSHPTVLSRIEAIRAL